MTASFARLGIKRARGHRHLLTGSAVLVVGAAIQALSGALFWLVAAKLDSANEVGAAAKLFQSILFVTYLAGLGLPVALARYAADRDDDSDTTFTWAVLATCASALVLGLVYLPVLSFFATDDHPSAGRILTDWNPIGGPLLFAVIVGGAALSLIADVRCMTARRWNLVMVRIALVGLVRFPMLFLVRSSSHRDLWLFVCAAGPMAVSGLVGATLAPGFAGGRLRLGPRPTAARAALRYSAVNYLSTLAYQAPYFALPVIVLTYVSSSTYAGFNVAWGIVAVAFYVPTALGQALLAEGGRDGARLRSQVRLALLIAIGLMTVGAVATFFGSGLVEKIYGAEYRNAGRVLPAMVAAGIPWAITSLLLSEVRILHRHLATVLITASLTAAIVVPALIMVPDRGIDGASAAWLIGNILAGTVAIASVAITRVRATDAHGNLAPGDAVDPSLADPETAADAAEVGITLAEPYT